MDSRPPILILREPVSGPTVEKYARAWFGDMVKVVIDVGRELLSLGGELHADGEAILLEDGSVQKDLWGANVYPFRRGQDRLEFTALINIRPSQGNPSMEVKDPDIRREMERVVSHLLPGGEAP